MSGQRALAWTAHPDAQAYRLGSCAPTAYRCSSPKLADRRFLVAIDDLPPRPEGVQLLARVEALDG